MKEQQEEMVKLDLEDMCILDFCVKIETKCEELYRYFAELYADIPEISLLWKKTANEEYNHAEQFKLAIRLRGVGIEGVRVDLSKAANIVEKLDTFLPRFKASNPTPAEALAFAIQLEEKLSEYHMSALVDFADNSLEKLFAAMAKYDKGHLEMLQKALIEISNP